MENTYGYIRTQPAAHRRYAGSDPEAQALQLRGAGVAPEDIYRDMGVSGSIGTNSRAGWHALNTRLTSGDTLVVAAIDRIGRRWMDTVNAVRNLRTGESGYGPSPPRRLPGRPAWRLAPARRRPFPGGHPVEFYGLGVGAGTGGHAAAHRGRPGQGPGGGKDPGAAAQAGL